MHLKVYVRAGSSLGCQGVVLCVLCAPGEAGGGRGTYSPFGGSGAPIVWVRRGNTTAYAADAGSEMGGGGGEYASGPVPHQQPRHLHPIALEEGLSLLN